MEKFLISIGLLLVSTIGHGQLLRNYFDAPGVGFRSLEKNRANDLKKETSSTTLRYALIEGTSVAEQLSKTKDIPSRRTNASAYIDYNEYKNSCNDYLNPLKKRKCTNTYNYLIAAHKKVLELVTIVPRHKINAGVKEQIGEKYTRITNTIFLELENLKLKAEKDNYYKRLFIKR